MATCPTCRRQFADDVETCPDDAIALLPDQAFSSADAELQKGHAVGDYIVEEAIAEGGFGTVYRVVHPLIGKRAAVKVLKRQFSSSPEMVSRFIVEARAVNQIRHKNIVDIFAFGALPDGRHYCVMELLEGTTLESLVDEQGPIPVADALPLIRQLGRALSAAHAAGITHRDLKPENVFVTFDEDGVATPKLLDFGIAKLRDGAGAMHKTRSGAPMGTPLYMSPEQIYDRPVDHRADIYSLGVLVHEVLTGSPPFDGRSVMDVLAAHATREPPAMSSLRPELPVELDAPVLQMMAKEPSARPQSVAEAVDELVAAAERAGIAIGPVMQRRTATGSNIPSPARSQPRRSRSGLAGDTDQSLAATLLHPHPTGDRRNQWLIGAAALVAILGIAFVLISMVRSPAEVGVEGTSLAVTPPIATSVASTPASPPVVSVSPVVTSAPPVEASPATIHVTFLHAPKGAEVVLDGKKIGTSEAGVDLPRGATKVVLWLRKTGFAPLKLQLTPDQAREEEARMKPLQRTVSGDLTF